MPLPPRETPWGFYFIVTFFPTLILAGVVLTPLRPYVEGQPDGVRWLIAALPLVLALPFALRVAHVGKRDGLTLGQAIAQAFSGRRR